MDISGQTFGSLTVLSLADRASNKKLRWLCKCVCGGETIAVGTNLRNGHTRSCGCRRAQKPTIHGGSRRGKMTSEYKSWASMLQRCSNPNHEAYKNYGGRGISVCDRWHDFRSFLDDMGERPTPQHTLERKHNDLGYSPSNCIWATKSEQALNRRPKSRVTA